MQDPKREIVDVVRGLVTRPSLQQQADIIRRFFAPDVSFSHYYISIGRSAADLTAIYQFANLAVRYQRVEFEQVLYDAEADAITLHMKVYVRPWHFFWRESILEFLCLLELEDFTPPQVGGALCALPPPLGHALASCSTLTAACPSRPSSCGTDGPRCACWQEDGAGAGRPQKTLKRIKRQHDYFQRGPILVLTPVIGPIYASQSMRLVIGHMQAFFLRLLRNLVCMLLPDSISHGLGGVWHSHVAGGDPMLT
eukprot:SM000020S05970  [mRNA]  locus=s20:111573:112827:- [translate_table: standard]